MKSAYALITLVLSILLLNASDVNAALITSHVSKCVDVAGPGANGNIVHLWECHGSFNQQFAFVAGGQIKTIGTFEFGGAQKCLDVLGFGTADGTPVQVFDCHGGLNQQWYFFNGQIISRQSGKCLDILSNNTANGTKIQIWTCNGSTAQQWQIR